MDVTDADVARIPPRNIRVPREHFVEVWRAAAQLSAEQGARGVTDWYAGAVATTCRWMAAGISRLPAGPSGPARAPVTGRTRQAYEELIQEEFLAAERLDMLVERPQWLANRPGWSEGIVATLRWAWMRTGPAPIPVDVRATG